MCEPFHVFLHAYPERRFYITEIHDDAMKNQPCMKSNQCYNPALPFCFGFEGFFYNEG